MKRVLYLSHATPEVYAIIREAVPSGFELVTLEGTTTTSAGARSPNAKWSSSAPRHCASR